MMRGAPTIFRLEMQSRLSGHGGFEWHPNEHQAKRRKDFLEQKFGVELTVEVKEFETPRSNRQLLDLLNVVAAHNDNG